MPYSTQLLWKVLPKKVGHNRQAISTMLTYFCKYNFLQIACCRVNLPSSCPSLVYLEDMYGICKPNVPLLVILYFECVTSITALSPCWLIPYYSKLILDYFFISILSISKQLNSRIKTVPVYMKLTRCCYRQ